MTTNRLLLLIARASLPLNDLVAMTLGWMCDAAGVRFETYYAADHEHGGLFAPHGSPVISGHHGQRIARAMATFDTTVIRFDRISLFASLFNRAATRVIDATADLRGLYEMIADDLDLDVPRRVLLFNIAHPLPPAVFYRECVSRAAMALPMASGVAGELLDLSGDDPALACVTKHIDQSAGVDLYEPLLAGYMLAFNQRSRRLILPYRTRAEAIVRRDQMMRLLAGRSNPVSYGRWFGDAELQPLAAGPTAYSVVEPHRHILSVFADHPTSLPQPARSWTDLEPSDEQLNSWIDQKKILASWVLHSGELSHNDSVMAFMDWSSMTRVKIGAGVHWQRYHFDPDVVEPMQVPPEEGGVLGLVEPVLHSAGSGILWETAGEPIAIAAMMRQSADQIAKVAGSRFAPRGVYCFGDHLHQAESTSPGRRQLSLWKAIEDVGFEYLITSALPGASRVLYRAGSFVVLNQAGKWYRGSPFVRGTPATFADHESHLADQAGWMIGAIDTPIHGSQIYTGHPYEVEGERIRISEFYDYVRNGGLSGRLVSATPRTVARYARMLMDRDRCAK